MSSPTAKRSQSLSEKGAGAQRLRRNSNSMPSGQSGHKQTSRLNRIGRSVRIHRYNSRHGHQPMILPTGSGDVIAQQESRRFYGNPDRMSRVIRLCLLQSSVFSHHQNIPFGNYIRRVDGKNPCDTIRIFSCRNSNSSGKFRFPFRKKCLSRPDLAESRNSFSSCKKSDTRPRVEDSAESSFCKTDDTGAVFVIGRRISSNSKLFSVTDQARVASGAYNSGSLFTFIFP